MKKLEEAARKEAVFGDQPILKHTTLTQIIFRIKRINSLTPNYCTLQYTALEKPNVLTGEIKTLT